MAPLVIQLALSALQAIAQVAVVCSFGHILARKGYLNHQLQKGLSTLSVKFFTPCLLFANTAASVTRDNFLQLWPLPVYFILFSATAWLIARIGATCFGFTKSQTRFTIATLMFSNTNSLPIGLIESLAMSGAAVWLHWREDESREALAARGIAYVVFYSILGNVIRWSYGVFLLEHDLDAVSTNACITSNTSDTHPIQKPSRKGKLPAIDVERANRRSSASSISSSSHASLVATSTPHERSPLLDSTSRTYLRPPTILLTGPAHQASLVVEEDTHPDASTRILPSSTSYFASSTTTPVDSSESDSDSEYEDVCDTIIVDRMTIDKDEDDQIECERLLDQDGSPNVPDHPHRPPHRSFSRRLRHVIHRIKHYLASVHHFLRPILTAPFLAALFGLLVALTPLRSLLVDPDAPLRTTLFAAVKSCGNAAVPVILICLGAQLTTLAYSQTGLQDLESQPASPTYRTYPSYSRVIPFVVFCRLFLLPLLAVVTVWFTLPLAGGLRDDPMFRLTVMLLGACPTAINLMTVCQARGCFERPMGRVLMWEYFLSAISMVGWCMIFLWIVQPSTTNIFVY